MCRAPTMSTRAPATSRMLPVATTRGEASRAVTMAVPIGAAGALCAQPATTSTQASRITGVLPPTGDAFTCPVRFLM